MSACAEILSPGVVATSLLQSGSGIATERGPQNLIVRCPGTPKERPDPATRKAAIIMAKTPSFRHGLPESSAMDGNLSVHKCLIKHDWQILVSRPCDWIPASRQE